MTPTPNQVRRARALLGWTSYRLAAQCEVGQHVIASFEDRGELVSSRARSEAARQQRLDQIRAALEAAGIEFIEDAGGSPGVRLRHPPEGD